MITLFTIGWLLGFFIALILTIFILTRDEKPISEEQEDIINQNKNK